MNKRIPIILGLLLVFLSVWVMVTPNKFIHSITERLNDLGYDVQLRTRVLTENSKVISPIAIIDIDDKSLQAIGRWPWTRGKMAELVDAMQKQGAAVIAFDIFFSEPQKNIVNEILEKLNASNQLNSSLTAELQNKISLFDEDAILAKSLASGNVNLAVGLLLRNDKSNELPSPLFFISSKEASELGIIKANGYISNIPILQKAAHGSGFINVFPDADGIIRRAPLIMQYQNGIYPALALQSVLLFLNEKVELVTPNYNDTKKLEGIKFSDRVIPTNEKGEILIPFIGRSYTFDYYSAVDVLKGDLPKDSLAGKILFVGTSATGLGDLKGTAIQNPYPGVEVQATIANGILNNSFSYVPAWTFGANIFLAVILGLISTFVFPYLGPRMLGSMIVLLPPCLILINNVFWTQTGLVLSLLIPIILVLLVALLNIIYGYLFETRRREELKDMFGQYVPKKHIDEMLKSKSDFGMRGEDRDMSVLFADIRNFTSISEGMPVPQLVEMLNSFFTPMTEIIFNHQGTIDKYIGDLIMAFWGAPLKDKHHARNVLYAALDMQEKVKEMQKIFKENNLPEIHIGIGVNSGIMSVGDMGSRFRRNYTVLGDSVNLASRVESLTKFYGVDIMATQYTQHNQPRFVFRKLDKVRVKGKHEAVELYEVICTEAHVTEGLKEELGQYHAALDFYFKQQWAEAANILSVLHQKDPSKKIYSIYLDRINIYKDHPLASDWDGVYTHSTK